MKTLIAEDDFTSRKLMQGILSAYGRCDLAVDGEEAVEAVRKSLAEQYPYDLVCLDIMMPKMDGNEALVKIREMEKQKGIIGPKEVKVIMTTALGEPKDVVKALYQGGATVYLVKPIAKHSLLEQLREMGLIE